jgi:aminocarboxymuconate-semialdehyde decarboxylase
VIGRLDHGARVRPELAHVKQPPSAYLRRFEYDTIGHDDRVNLNLVRLVGADRVLLGSDYCFDMGLAESVQTVNRLTDLPQSEREQILGRNAAQLLGLD